MTRDLANDLKGFLKGNETETAFVKVGRENERKGRKEGRKEGEGEGAAYAYCTHTRSRLLHRTPSSVSEAQSKKAAPSPRP